MATCPNCNYEVDDHADVCGNCGTPMKRRGGFVQIAPTGTYQDPDLAELAAIEQAESRDSVTETDERGFARAGQPGGLGGETKPQGFAPPDEPGGTFIPVAPLVRRRSVLPIVVGLFVLGVVGAIVFFAGDLIDKAVEEVNSGIEDFNEGFEGGNGATIEEEPLPAGSYKNVRELIADLDKGGLPCKQVQVTVDDQFSSVGTCTPKSKTGFPLTIMMFFDRLALDATRDGLASAPAGTSFYVYDKNWFVLAPTPKMAKQVQAALGGRLHK